MKNSRKLLVLLLLFMNLIAACNTRFDPNVSEQSDEQVKPGEMNPHHGS